MGLTVLNVAYPFAPVSFDTTGGAEQILAALDRALTRAGHRSIVLACEGSEVTGTLVPVPVHSTIGPAAWHEAHARHRAAIAAALERWPVDVVHMHGVDFQAYLPTKPVPVLVTLHLSMDRYAPDALCVARPATWFNCVSADQQAAWGKRPDLLPVIENGVDLDRFCASHARRRFALMLARICPEKGVHLAIAAARLAGLPLLIAGQVFPYEEHRRYFTTEIAPQLGRDCRFLGPVDAGRKRRLLAAAHCVLVTSLVEETSSLVAREAAAAGTPVVAFDRGALRETVEHGRTGFLVRDVEGMAAAIQACHGISAETCRATARRRFSLDGMTDRYIDVYDRLARPGLPVLREVT